MKLIASGVVWPTGSFAANAISVAAAIATLRDVLKRETYPQMFELNQQLANGYRAAISRYGLRACVQAAGVTGAVFFTEGPVRNYRDASKASQRVFMAYWCGMLERGIIPQCYGRDDAWTLTLAHSHKDIERVISAFDDLAGVISEVQRGSEIEAARTMK